MKPPNSSSVSTQGDPRKVAICAGCNNVYPWAACIIGVVAGAAYCGWSQLILKVMKVDDPLDAVAVHFGGGFWGVIAVPIFATEGGIITSGGSLMAFKGLGWNILGGVAIAVWTGLITTTMFGFLRLAGVLRVEPEIEEKGLDIPKHGEPAMDTAGSWRHPRTTCPSVGLRASTSPLLATIRETPLICWR